MECTLRQVCQSHSELGYNIVFFFSLTTTSLFTSPKKYDQILEPKEKFNLIKIKFRGCLWSISWRYLRGKQETFLELFTKPQEGFPKEVPDKFLRDSVLKLLELFLWEIMSVDLRKINSWRSFWTNSLKASGWYPGKGFLIMGKKSCKIFEAFFGEILGIIAIFFLEESAWRILDKKAVMHEWISKKPEYDSGTNAGFIGKMEFLVKHWWITLRIPGRMF